MERIGELIALAERLVRFYEEAQLGCAPENRIVLFKHRSRVCDGREQSQPRVCQMGSLAAVGLGDRGSERAGVEALPKYRGVLPRIQGR